MSQVVRDFLACFAVGLALDAQAEILRLGVIRAQAVQPADLDAQLAGRLTHRLVKLAFPGLVGGEQELLGLVQLVGQVNRQFHIAHFATLALDVL